MTYYHPEDEAELPFARPLKWVAALAALFAVSLIIDYFMPVVCTDAQVQEKIFIKESNRFGGDTYDLRIITNKMKFRAKPDLFAAIEDKTDINVCHTPIYRSVKHVRGVNTRNNLPFSFEASLPLFKGYGAFPISLLLVACFCLFFKQDDTIAYGSGIITIVLLISMLLII